MYKISKDEMFLIGNVGMQAVIMGLGEKALPLLQFMLKERPKNGTSYIAMAFYHLSYDNVDSALKIIEEDDKGFHVEHAMNELMAVYIHLLSISGRQSEVITFGQSLIDENIVDDETAIKSINETIDRVNKNTQEFAHS